MTSVTPLMSDLPENEEYRRLRALEVAYDPPTMRLLDRIGVAPGWRCLEVAAGAGSIALALQLKAGSVIALDKDVRYIRHLASPSFAVLEAAVEEAELPRDIDLVHARFLLDLVPNPADVIHRMCSCLRSGGWLLVEEFDDITLMTSLGSERARALHGSVVSAKQAAWETRGLDNYLGRRLPAWLVSMGLTEVDSECGCRVRLSGSPGAFAWRQSLASMRRSLNESGLTEEELEEYVSQLDSPGFSYFSPLVVRAFGRIP